MIETYINKEDGSVLYVLYKPKQDWFTITIFNNPELKSSVSYIDYANLLESKFYLYTSLYGVSLKGMGLRSINIMVYMLNSKSYYVKGKVCKRLHIYD